MLFMGLRHRCTDLGLGRVFVLEDRGVHKNLKSINLMSLLSIGVSPVNPTSLLRTDGRPFVHESCNWLDGTTEERHNSVGVYSDFLFLTKPNFSNWKLIFSIRTHYAWLCTVRKKSYDTGDFFGYWNLFSIQE